MPLQNHKHKQQGGAAAEHELQDRRALRRRPDVGHVPDCQHGDDGRFLVQIQGCSSHVSSPLSHRHGLKQDSRHLHRTCSRSRRWPIAGSLRCAGCKISRQARPDMSNDAAPGGDVPLWCRNAGQAAPRCADGGTRCARTRRALRRSAPSIAGPSLARPPGAIGSRTGEVLRLRKSWQPAGNARGSSGASAARCRERRPVSAAR